MPHLFARIELDDLHMAKLREQRLPAEDLGETAARLLISALEPSATQNAPTGASDKPAEEGTALPEPAPRQLPDPEQLFEVAVLIGGEWSTLAWALLPSDARLAAQAILKRRSFLEHAQVWKDGNVVAELGSGPEVR